MRFGPIGRENLRAGAAAALIALAMPAAWGQDAPASSSLPTPAPAEQLRGIEDTLRASEAQRSKIEANAEALRAERAQLNTALIETTARVQEAETALQNDTERLAGLNASQAALRQSLDGRSGVIADVLAILQRIGRSPPPAILVRPKDMSEAINAAIMLGAVVPELSAETAALARDLNDLDRLRQSIQQERDRLSSRTDSLQKDKARLSQLVEARQRALSDAEAALGAERDRSKELARQAGTLKDLIAHMEAEVGAAKSAAASAQAAADEIRAKAASAGAADPGRLRPAVAFAETKGRLALPVSGPVVRAFGDLDAYGSSEKGMSIATPAGATVASPIDGWVVFSGPYRGYGQVLILNAGDSYYMVLAGMDRITVNLGQFVLSGEPLAAMGETAARTATAAAIGAAQPVLYIELRRNGIPIDPAPWWMKSENEKARG